MANGSHHIKDMGRPGQVAVPGIQLHPTVKSHRTHVAIPHGRMDRIKEHEYRRDHQRSSLAHQNQILPK
eukprot:11564998-Prorocentrum_lima.AAC.1